jgi:ATP-dependent DNA helicase
MLSVDNSSAFSLTADNNKFIGMPSSSSSERDTSSSPITKPPTTAPSSPPEQPIMDEDDLDPSFFNDEEKAIFNENLAARKRNEEEERRIQKKAALKRKKKTQDTPAEREEKARQLDDLLTKSTAFGDILTKKTAVLGRVGSGFDGKALGEHNLVLATQPECMTGGKMRDYQLEGLTWMYEIGIQGISGILADEMGLGKTIQTISLLAKYRDDKYYGPFLIIAPLSTLSNWMEEFAKWCPTLPVEMYHGTPEARREKMKKVLLKNYNSRADSGNANAKFPVVLTTPEIVIRDANELIKIKWETIIIVGARVRKGG